MRQILIGPLLLLLTGYGYAWNAVGHQLIAQIAYDNLNPAAKRLCNQYLHAYTKKAAPYDFIISSTWLDMLKRKRIHRYDALHYIDIPFSQDGTKLPAIAKPNALSKMQQAIKVLSSKKTSYYSKGLNLRILIHIVGDIHQPLHTTTQVSKRFPHGDLGGNLFILSANPNGKNLHK
ncbi:MAG: S1/P1 nuclease, partial [bacterium]|nr:S1/P1 nuclease [bacterium]